MKKNILFVCTGNSCRSVMAEGLFKHLLGDRAGDFSVGSAGVSAMDGFHASPDTVEVMRENGVDVSDHQSRRLNAAMVRTADRIFVMEQGHKEAILRTWPEAREKTHLLTEYSTEKGVDRDIPDPMTHPGSYENVFRLIRDGVNGIAATMGLLKGDRST